MNIVVAFVLESFMFRIQYRRQMEVEDIEGKSHGLLPPSLPHLPGRGPFRELSEMGLFIIRVWREMSEVRLFILRV